MNLPLSGVLALGGISGTVLGDMQLRMIGVVGYAGLFPVAALLLAILFRRTGPVVTAKAKASPGSREA
jgi:repressor of nif and glnA expression